MHCRVGWKKLLQRNIQQKFVPGGKKKRIHDLFYMSVLDRLLKHSTCLHPNFYENKNCSLLHIAHHPIMQSFRGKKITLLHHHPYSPFLSPVHYFLLPKLKLKLKPKGH
ncbi:hypothetical protein X975_25199, partial [Stegodyphus mimosarum]